MKKNKLNKEHQKALRAVQKRKAKLLKKTKALSVRDLETIQRPAKRPSKIICSGPPSGPVRSFAGAYPCVWSEVLRARSTLEVTIMSHPCSRCASCDCSGFWGPDVNTSDEGHHHIMVWRLFWGLGLGFPVYGKPKPAPPYL